MPAICLAACLIAATLQGGPGAHAPLGSVAMAQEEGVCVLRSEQGVQVRFERNETGWRWTEYEDEAARLRWPIAGPLFSLQTTDGRRTNLGDTGFETLTRAEEGAVPCVVLETQLGSPPVSVRQTFSFCPDQRTMRVSSELKATGGPVTIQRVGLLEVQLPGQALKLMGPGHVSSPVFGDRTFAGVEHPSALCQVDEDTLYLAQHSYTRVGPEWTKLPAAVFGSASEDDVAAYGDEPLRRAFLRYLDTVRVKPADMHIHYNNWWTMPVPFTEEDVLGNITELRQGLYDETGLFFDSYAMDMGWSNSHSVWDIDKGHYPQGFRRIRDALGAMDARPGLWVSPSSLYPPALDNRWLEDRGYETTPGSHIGRFACLALGGRYQRDFKAALLRHARSGNLGHVKCDGLAWPCDVATHGHPTGIESYQPIAEGLMDVMDALRAQSPDIALEPTCLGYHPSPWWLVHTPFIIGPFGDDCPPGRSPCPEWLEALTTARDVANLHGRDAFLMPSSALQCFDIVVQCPGDFENHGVMAIGRGRWFLSCYINPRFMDEEEWRFFAALVEWARRNRELLQEPVPIGGDPAQRRAYGYAYRTPERELYFARNPWMKETRLALEGTPRRQAREVRMLYPSRAVLCRVAAGEPLPELRLGPYELAVVEVVPTTAAPRPLQEPPEPEVLWSPTVPAGFERLVYNPEPPAYGPDWTSPDGDAAEELVFSTSGSLTLAVPAELCILTDGGPEETVARCALTVNGAEVAPTQSRSALSFSAAGGEAPETWNWFTAPLAAGQHNLAIRVTLADANARCGVFVRGLAPCRSQREHFGEGPQLPLYNPGKRAWSRTLVEPTTLPEAIPTRQVQRRIERIDGLYLDTLDWTEATAGWGEVHRNRSVMGTPMLMAGRTYRRGIGTHANSRIVCRLPEGYRRFRATIGCDQEVRGNSIVFAVEADGKELFRGPVMRYATPPIGLDLPIAGAKELTLIVDDGGDGIGADHGDWADAVLVRQ